MRRRRILLESKESPMPVKQSTVGEYRLLAVSGDIRGSEEDHRTLRRLGHQCLAESPRLAVNLRHATFIDSQTLGLFVELLRTAQSRGGEVALVDLGERARKWFELSGLEHIFRILPGEAALAAASKAKPAASRSGAALEKVNVERMVAELEAALGEATAGGEPSAVGPVDEKALTEIEKLLAEK
jgi:anti-anti-sigma factor